MLPGFLRRRPAQRIATSFGWLAEKPFPRTETPAYAARYERGAYLLELRKPGYFAWEPLAGDRVYSDFALRVELELDPSNGHSAIGVLLRYRDDENFYSFLVSDRGLFRFDLLRNNHPVPLIEWTALPAAPAAGGARKARIIAHGSRFTFALDEEWIGEIEEESIASGSVAFAAQNFADGGRGVFRLRHLELEARPLAVEREHYRWSYFFPALPEARARLAETLFGMGSTSAAAIQMRKALKGREGATGERFLLAECYVRLSMLDEALAEIGAVLRREPRHAEARAERANVLYLANRLLEARDDILAGFGDGSLAPSPVLWNILGNAEYGLGNWEKAVAAYRRAVEAQPEEPHFLRNAARGLERAGAAEEALALYLRASRVFFRDEAYDELSLIVPRALALDPSNREVRALEAKMLYHEGRVDEAFTRFSALAEEGETDSAVHYLLGLILTSRGGRAEALPHLEEAARMEPSFPLYQFRLAEALHALGRDPRPALETARSLAPQDPWINNLDGLLLMQAGDMAGAIERFGAAHAASPDQTDILINYSEALSLSGRDSDALALLAGRDDARLANQRGNILARQGSYEGAVREYEAAIRLDPESHAYKENCAAACIEIDMVHRAEELLSQVEPEHPSASVYNMIGTVAALKGEQARAELAYSAGLGREPGNPDIATNLALLRLERGDWQKARAMAAGVLAAAPNHPRARALLEKIRQRHEQRLQCAECGREWWAPKDLPPQPGLTVRGEPPADAPAGRCPVCRKVFCVGCASARLRESRFYCPDCGESLRLSDDLLRWLLARRLEHEQPAGGST
jgi:tetratricopeptide (TPR) repeat protein